MVVGKVVWRLSLFCLVVAYSVLGVKVGTISAGPAADVTVAQDGSGDYHTVGEALAAAPAGNERFRIYIRNGAYFEKLQITRANITLMGESGAGVRIFYNHCSSDAGGTAKSASVTVLGDGFSAENISFENTFDYDGSAAANKQAVAVLTQADRVAFKNCRFMGYQDTLFVRGSRQYFEKCYIQGHTDFIFGEGTAVFKDCTLHSLYRNGASITAPSTLASTKYGFVFMDCTLTGAEEMISSVYLGRPWHPSSAKQLVNSSAVFIRSHLGPHIASASWTSMSGVQPDGERFLEYQNTGVGAAVNPSRPQLTADQAAGYSVTAILGGTDNWNPGVPEG